MTKELHGAPGLMAVENSAGRDNEESGPQVGLFYLIHGKLYWQSMPVERAHATPYLNSYPKTHFQYWKDTLLKMHPSLNAFDSLSFPRGRVVFDKTENAYEVMADKCIIENPELIERIVSEMKLAEARVKTTWDINCECPQCRTAREREMHDAPKDSIEESFHHTQDGRVVFSPWGSSGTGYIVPRRRELRKLKRRVAFAYAIAVSAGIGALELIFSNMTDLAMLVIGILAFVSTLVGFDVWIRYLCSGMTKIDRNSASR